MKIEKTLIPIFGVLGIAVFIVLCSLLGKRDQGGDPVASAEPTEAPYVQLVHELSEMLGGECTDGDKFSTFTFKSKVDGEYAAVNSYMRSGILCMSITRPLKSAVITPEPTEEDIFGDNGSGAAAEPSDTADSFSSQIAAELFSCISHLPSLSEDSDVTGAISKALDGFLDGSGRKANILYGIYLIKLSYSADDGLLTAICEPA